MAAPLVAFLFDDRAANPIPARRRLATREDASA